MKTVVLLFTCMFFSSMTKIDASLRSPGGHAPAHSSANPVEARIYLQMPGDEVLTGVMEFISNHSNPAWLLRPYTEEAHNSQERVFIYMPRGRNLIANLEPFHKHYNQSFREYRCFITREMRILYATHLRQLNYPMFIPRVNIDPLIFIRIPDRNNTVYGGRLSLEDGHLPHWLSRELGL